MFFAQSPEESLWGECEEDREKVDVERGSRCREDNQLVEAVYSHMCVDIVLKTKPFSMILYGWISQKPSLSLSSTHC